MMAVTAARRAVGAAVALGRAVAEGAREVVAALRAPAPDVHAPAPMSTPVVADPDAALQYESKFTRSVFFLLGTAVSIAVATTWSDALHNLAAVLRGGHWDLPVFVMYALAVSVVAVAVATAAAVSIEQRRRLGRPLNVTRLRMLALTSSALGICVGWAWYDVVSVTFNTSLPSVRASVLVSLLSALTVTAGGAAVVAWMTTAMDGSRTHLVRQLFVLLSNAAALVVGFTWQTTLTVAVEHLTRLGSLAAIVLRLAVVGGVYGVSIVLRRTVRTWLEAPADGAGSEPAWVGRRRNAYVTLLARMLGLLLGLAMSDALHALFLGPDATQMQLGQVVALAAYGASTVVIALSAAWWFSAKPDAKAAYSKDARALAISCAGFLMGWAVKDVAHGFFVLYLTTAAPGQVAAYLLFAVVVTVVGSLLLRATLVPVDFRDDWYEYAVPDDDATAAPRPPPPAVPPGLAVAVPPQRGDGALDEGVRSHDTVT